jgi:Flp pilus assembly protein TadD
VIISVRSPAFAVLAVVLLLAPGWVAAQDRVAGANAAAAGGLAPGGANSFDAAPQTGMPKPKIDPAIEYAQGFTDFNLGRFATAQDEFDQSLKVDPNNPRTLFMLGEAKVALGDLKGATHAFEKALKFDPGQVTVRGEYAVTLAKLGRSDQAQAQLSIHQARAVACGGSCPEADDFKAEVGRIQAALSNPGKANS